MVLRVRVMSDGRPTTIEIARGSGHERLDHAARETVEKWRFEPARESGTAVDSWVQVPITFRLER